MRKEFYKQSAVLKSIRNIEFRILEDSPIPQGRKVTLDKGIIFDLFCHILAVVGATVSRQTYCSAMSIRAVEDIHVKAAKYQNAPIRGETFSRIDFKLSAEGIPYFLEINPLAGLNPRSSDLSIMAGKIGLTYHSLILEILDAALGRYPSCVHR